MSQRGWTTSRTARWTPRPRPRTRAKHQAETDSGTDLGQAKTGSGTDFGQAKNETEAEYQANGDRINCPLYQGKTEAKHQDKAK